MKRTKKAWLSGGAVLFAASQFAGATMVASDSFLVDVDGGAPASNEYTPGQLIGGTRSAPLPQGPDALGMTGPWLRTDIGDRDRPTALWKAEIGPETGGLDHPLIQSKGGSLDYDGLDFTGSPPDRRALARALDPTARSILGGASSVYMSLLLQVNDPMGMDLIDGGGVFVGFTEHESENTTRRSRGLLRGSQGFKIGVVNALDPTSGNIRTNLVYRSRDGVTTSDIVQSNVVLDEAVPGETYLVVVRVDKNAISGPGATSGNDRVRIWINPTDISSEAAAGPADFTLNDFSMQDSNAFRFFNLRGTPFGGKGVNFDEVIASTTWEDVFMPRPAPPTGEVPEPVSAILSLLGLGALGFATGARRARD